jgi:hypothetical protein
MKRTLIYLVTAASALVVACEKRGPIAADTPAQDLKPGLPQVPPEKTGDAGSGATGTRSDYQPSTGQGSQTETPPSPDDPEED